MIEPNFKFNIGDRVRRGIQTGKIVSKDHDFQLDNNVYVIEFDHPEDFVSEAHDGRALLPRYERDLEWESIDKVEDDSS